MKTFIAAAVVAVIGVASTSPAFAFAPAPLDQAQASIIIKTAGGCGRGYHRGVLGECVPNGAVVVAPGVGGVVVGTGPCGGRGRHKVCGPNGCRWVCN
jgi:hypothetical protein